MSKNSLKGIKVFACMQDTFACVTIGYLVYKVFAKSRKILAILVTAYRPPSGSENLALQELDLLMKNLPNENVTITGDFNIDFLSKNSDFEQILYSNHFIPLISIATHEKPGCKGSLIDNILTNSTDNFLTSGVLESRVSHHHPVFCCFNSCNGVPKQPDTPTPPQIMITVKLIFLNFLMMLTMVYITVQEFNYDEEGFKIVSSKLDELIDQNF